MQKIMRSQRTGTCKHPFEPSQSPLFNATMLGKIAQRDPELFKYHCQNVEPICESSKAHTAMFVDRLEPANRALSNAS